MRWGRRRRAKRGGPAPPSNAARSVPPATSRPVTGVTMRKPGAFDRLRRSAAASVSINATVTITPKNWCTREVVSADMLGGKLLIGAFTLALVLSGCDGERAAGTEPAPTSAREIFVDVSDAAGALFTHVNGMSGEFYFSEIIGSGVGLLDYDGDGKLDLLVLQGTTLGRGNVGGRECGARLFRNVSTAGGLRFDDVTEKSGLCSRGYGMGVAAADFDNDGNVDVFITHFGSANQLFRNNGDGTFSDITRTAVVAG